MKFFLSALPLFLGIMMITSPLQAQSAWKTYFLLPSVDSIRGTGLMQQTAPAFWWNGYGGLQTGIHHRMLSPTQGWYLQGSAWYSTGIGTISSQYAPELQDSFPRLGYRAEFSMPISRRALADQMRRTLQAISQFRDGLWAQELSSELSIRNEKGAQILRNRLYLRHWFRPTGAPQDFLPQPDLWTAEQGHFQIGTIIERQWKADSSTLLRTRIESRAGLLAQGQAYGFYQPEAILRTLLGPMGLRLRGIGRLSLGQTPVESALYLAGANPETAYQDPFFRARGWVPQEWYSQDLGQSLAQAHQGGGLGLRGYTGYRAEFADGTPSWRADHGLAVNAELSFSPLVPDIWGGLSSWLQADLYAFYDLGLMARSLPGRQWPSLETDGWRQDAGLGFSLRCLQCERAGLGPLAIRVDFPFFVSRPPAGGQLLDFRWVAGFGRSF